MKYCTHCGKEIDDAAVICVHCGAAVTPMQQPTVPVTDDAPSGGFAVLGFFFPIIGLILYLCWKDQQPLKAKSCGKGALIGVIVAVALSILSAIFVSIFAVGVIGALGNYGA